MDKTRTPTHTLVIDELTMGDMEAFEQMAGSKLLDAISPRIVRDENGRPIPNPEDEQKRPFRMVQMTTAEFLAAHAIAAKQADRANQEQYTMEYARGLVLSKTVFHVDWGTPVGEEANPTVPADENTDAG